MIMLIFAIVIALILFRMLSWMAGPLILIFACFWLYHQVVGWPPAEQENTPAHTVSAAGR